MFDLKMEKPKVMKLGGEGLFYDRLELLKKRELFKNKTYLRKRACYRDCVKILNLIDLEDETFMKVIDKRLQSAIKYIEKFEVSCCKRDFEKYGILLENYQS